VGNGMIALLIGLIIGLIVSGLGYAIFSINEIINTLYD
jgi:hypothetical protein